MCGTGRQYNRFPPSDGIGRAGGTQCGVHLPEPPARVARGRCRVKSLSLCAVCGCIRITVFLSAAFHANQIGLKRHLKDFSCASSVRRSLQRTPKSFSQTLGRKSREADIQCLCKTSRDGHKCSVVSCKFCCCACKVRIISVGCVLKTFG